MQTRPLRQGKHLPITLESLDPRILLATALTYTGTSAADNYLLRPKTSAPGTIEVLRNGSIIDTQLAANVISMTFNTQLGNDTLTVTTSTTPVIFKGGTTSTDHDVLNLNAGSYAFSTDAITATAHLSINVTSATLSLLAAQHLESLNLGPSAIVTTAPGHHATLRTELLSLSPTAKLDLNDNDLIVNTGNFSTLSAAVLTGYRAAPDSTATGIISTHSQTIINGATILALFDNTLAGLSDYPPGSGTSIAPGAIIGKYTFIGDTNQDDQVTPQDYTAFDANLGTTVNPAISWFYGDTNFDGNIDPTDYTGIDSSLGLHKIAPPIQLIQHAAAGFEFNTTSLSLAFPSDNVTGHFLIITGTAARSAQTLNISDTAGDTFVTAIGPINDPAQAVTAYIGYVTSAKGGPNTITITPTDGLGHALEIHISEWTGINPTSPLDQTSSATGIGTQITSGTKTPTQNNELIFGYTFPNQNATAGPNFTPISLINGDLDEYLIQTTAAPIAATYTQSPDKWLALLATFRPED
jgi:hypothetical protein